LEGISVRGTLKQIRERLPYGFHEMQSAFYINGVVIILGYMVSDEELAIYKSIQLVVVPVSIFPLIASQVLLKQLSSPTNDPNAATKTFRKFQRYCLGVGAIFVSSAFLFKDELIGVFYGAKFSEIQYVNTLLVIFLFTFLLRFVSSMYGALLTAKGRQGVRVYATTIMIITTSVGVVVFTKHFGVVGAAYANGVSILLLLFIYAIYAEKRLLGVKC